MKFEVAFTVAARPAHALKFARRDITLAAALALAEVAFKAAPAQAAPPPQMYTASSPTTFNAAVQSVDNFGGNISIGGSFNAQDPTAATTNIPINLRTFILGISGMGGPAGSLDVSSGGAGILALTGTNTFNGLRASSSTVTFDGDAALGSGNITLNSTTIRALNSLTVAKAITLTGFGATIDTQAYIVTLAGQIGGPSPLFKVGNGTLRLTGANSYGATTVLAGTLEVDGSAPSSITTVNAGGTLSGTGSIGKPSALGTTINAGGTLSPGSMANSYGTLTVYGPLRFEVGSFYNVAVTPKQNNRTDVIGNATISGGAVNVSAATGRYQKRQYTILNAVGGVSGTFSAVTTNLAFLVPTLTYDANNVYLNITGNSANGRVDYRTAAKTQNQFNVASGLTVAGRSVPNGAGGRILDGLAQLTVPQAQAAFDGLSGEGITATQNLANRSAQMFNGTIFDQTTFYGNGGVGNQIVLTTTPGFVALAPDQTAAAARAGQPIRELADLPAAHIAPTFVAPQRTWRAWATGFGGTEDIHGNAVIGAARQDNTIYGGALGIDYQLTSNYLVGVALGGSSGDFSVPGRSTFGSTTGGHVAIYDLATFGSFYGASSSSFSYFSNKTTRSVAGFGGLGGETERGNFDSHEFRTRLEFGRHFDALPGTGPLPMLSRFGTVTPFVALEIAQLRSNGFGETSMTGPGLFRLAINGQSAASVPGYVGLRFQNVMPLGGLTFLPSLQLAYVHEFAPYRSQIGTLVDLPGTTFLVDGARPARDAAQVKAGGELKIGTASSLFANFDGEFSGVNHLYAGKGGFQYIW